MEQEQTKKIKKKCRSHGTTDHGFIPSKNIYVCEGCVRLRWFHIDILNEYNKLYKTKESFLFSGF